MKKPMKMKKAAVKMAKKSPAKKMKDLSGDNKITKKDVLIGRGVLPAATKMKKMKESAMKMKKAGMKMVKKSAMMMKKAAGMKMMKKK